MTHSFERHPHRTTLALSAPVLLSLIAEPVTRLVDTAFIARLGAAPAAALGVGAVVLPAVMWIFNFLSIGTQTEVARAHGAAEPSWARAVSSLALLFSAIGGIVVVAVCWPLAGTIATWMEASGEVHQEAVTYLEISLLGAPATLLSQTAFGALRGVQNVRTPLLIALVSQAINVVLDLLLIFGAGPIPAMGIAGAAWASTASQWFGAAWALWELHRRFGFCRSFTASHAHTLLVVGRDLILRTALLMSFLIYSTRAATGGGEDCGAAHSAIRQIWLSTALALDAFAATAQMLVGYFVGRGALPLARRAAAVTLTWGVGFGLALTVAMLLAQGTVAQLFVPASARETFASAWWIAAWVQPVNAASFVTDGVHWATRDYRYLRNGMLIATAFGIAGIEMLATNSASLLRDLWLVTAGWIAIRAAWGVVRVWPGGAATPLHHEQN